MPGRTRRLVWFLQPIRPRALEGDTSGRSSLRSSDLQVLSLRDLKKWRICILAITNAFSQADGFVRAVCLRAPAEWGPEGSCRIRKLRAPARGQNDTPAAFLKATQLRGLVCSSGSRWLELVPGFAMWPASLSYLPRGGGAVRAITTNIDDIPGRGRPGGEKSPWVGWEFPGRISSSPGSLGCALTPTAV